MANAQASGTGAPCAVVVTGNAHKEKTKKKPRQAPGQSPHPPLRTLRKIRAWLLSSHLLTYEVLRIVDIAAGAAVPLDEFRVGA
jgi:hypothetical protein